MKKTQEIENKLSEHQSYKEELSFTCEHFVSVSSDFNNGFMEGLKWVLGRDPELEKQRDVKKFIRSMMSRTLRGMEE